ncbi:MAG: TolC family protein [Bryobacteraceae bacterium]
MKTALIIAAAAGIAFSQTTPAASKVTLEQAIQEALKNNLDLAAERHGLAVVETRGITAALKPNPILTLQAQTLDVLGVGFNAANPAGPNQFNGHVDYVYERGGKRQERVALAAADKTLSQTAIREITRRLIFDVQSTFVDVQQAGAAVTLAQDNLRSLRGIVQVNESRVNAGDLAQVELDRSRVAALQYETAVEQARLQQEQAKTRLQRLLGRTATSPDFDVVGDMRREEKSDNAMAILDRALQRRPDLLASQQSQARSRADLKLQLANGKVDYLIGAEYTYQRAYGFGGSSIGLSLSVPLPVYSRNQGEIARAEREAKQNAARSTALEAGIKSEVELAWRQYEVSRRLLTNIESTLLSRAKQVRDVTEYSYRRGEATLVEFLDAQRAFNDAVQSHNEARANFARSLYLIDAVSGVEAPASGGGK